MKFPILLAVIRASDHKQWEIAQLAHRSESRLSKIIRHGGATPEERERLSQLLGVNEAELFGPGPVVKLNPDQVANEQLVGEADGGGSR